MQYSEKIGTGEIYNHRGDYVGTIPDEDLRQDALIGLNGTAFTDEEVEAMEKLNKLGLDDIEELKKLEDLIFIYNDLDSITLKLDEVDAVDYLVTTKVNEAIKELEYLAECALIENFGPDQFDIIMGAVNKLKAIAE